MPKSASSQDVLASCKNISCEAIAAYAAHVPLGYDVPALIKHQFWPPRVITLRCLLPERLSLSPVRLDPPLLVVVVAGAALSNLGRYLTPVEEQLDVDRTGVVGTNVSIWMNRRRRTNTRLHSERLKHTEWLLDSRSRSQSCLALGSSVGLRTRGNNSSLAKVYDIYQRS
jgi:hypothetical protein